MMGFARALPILRAILRAPRRLVHDYADERGRIELGTLEGAQGIVRDLLRAARG
jgi:hypothetical protein